MKKVLFSVFAAFMAVALLSGCETKTNDTTKPSTKRFYRRTVMAYVTSTACSACPTQAKTLVQVKEQYPDRFDIMALHCYDGKFKSTLSTVNTLYNVLDTKYGLASLPSCYFGFNMAYDVIGAWNTPLWIGQVVKVAKNAVSSSKDPVGILASAKVTDKTLNVDVTFKTVAKNEYYIGAVLIEDGIVEPQNDNGTEVKDYVHNNVTRALITSGDTFTESVGEVDAHKEVKKNFTLDLSKIEGSSKWNLDNCRVCIYVCEKTEVKEGMYVLGYKMSNSVSVKLGESIDEYKYESAI